MRKWELWENPEEGRSSFFPVSNTHARVMAVWDGQTKTWEVEAASHDDAMRAMNEHLGYGPYVPRLRDDGTPHPEDEDDEIRKEQEGELFDAWPVANPSPEGVAEPEDDRSPGRWARVNAWIGPPGPRQDKFAMAFWPAIGLVFFAIWAAFRWG